MKCPKCKSDRSSYNLLFSYENGRGEFRNCECGYIYEVVEDYEEEEDMTQNQLAKCIELKKDGWIPYRTEEATFPEMTFGGPLYYIKEAVIIKVESDGSISRLDGEF